MKYLEYGFASAKKAEIFLNVFDNIGSKTKIKETYVSGPYVVVGFETYDEDECYETALSIDKKFQMF